MSHRLHRRARGYKRSLLLALVVALVSTALAYTVIATAKPTAVPPGTLAVTGNAYGGSAKIGGTVKSGKTAEIAFGAGGCTLNGQALPIHKENSVASSTFPQLKSS